MTNPDNSLPLRLLSPFFKDLKVDLKTKLEQLPPGDFLRFLHQHVQHDGGSWIVRNPGTKANWRTKPHDSLKSIRKPDTTNQNITKDSRYLWTKEFLSDDNFAIYLQLLRTKFNDDEFTQQMNEGDYNFIVYWATLVIRYSNLHHKDIPDDIVVASKHILHFVHGINGSPPYRQPSWFTSTFSHPAKYRKYRHFLGVFEQGVSRTRDHTRLAAQPDGKAYSFLIDNLARKIPYDLKMAGQAGLMYTQGSDRLRYRIQQRDRLRGRSNFAVALSVTNELSAAYYVTEMDQKRTLAHAFEEITRQVKKMTGSNDPLLYSDIETTAECSFIKDYLGKPNAQLGASIILKIENLAQALEKIKKESSVDTWPHDRENLEIFIRLLKKLSTFTLTSPLSGSDTHVYLQHPVADPPDSVALLDKLKTCATVDLPRALRSNHLLRSSFLGRLPGPYRLRPNYPIFGAVTLTTIFSLYGYLESQGPGFTWATELKAGIERVISDIGSNANGFLEWINGNSGSEGFNDSQQPVGRATAFLENLDDYHPTNGSLEELKLSQNQPDVFSVTTATDSQPWAIPNRTLRYAFNPNNPFEITWTNEEIRPFENFPLPIEQMPEQLPASDLTIDVNILEISEYGLMIPINFNPEDYLDIRLFSDRPAEFDSESSDHIIKYIPQLLQGDSGALFLYLPVKLGLHPEEPLHLTVSVALNGNRVFGETINPDSDFSNRGPAPQVSSGFGIDALGVPTASNFDRESLLGALFHDYEQFPQTPASPELQAFLIEQGFDFEELDNQLNTLYIAATGEDAPTDPSLLRALPPEFALQAEGLIYREVLTQMKELGFSYALEPSINNLLTPQDIRPYFILGRQIGLDCDGLSFVANVVAHTAQGRWDIIRNEIILAEADADLDHTFGGSINHAQLVLRHESGIFPTLETTSFVNPAKEVSPEEIQTAIDELNTIIASMDTSHQNVENVLKALVGIVVGLCALQAHKKINGRRRKALPESMGKPDLPAPVKRALRKIELMTIDKSFAALAHLSILEIAKMSEVLDVLLNPGYFGGAGDYPRLLNMILSFEFTEQKLAPTEHEALVKIEFLVKTIFNKQIEPNYAEALRATLDEALEQMATENTMKPILTAIRVLLD